jgi:hypothetical protein
MSDPCQDVLLDSNAYFRLGNSIRPLLHQSFGTSPKYSLHVLAELDDEYATNIRLRHKFEWVGQVEYRNDRKAKRYELRGNDLTEANNAFTFLLAYADEQKINLSRCCAYKTRRSARPVRAGHRAFQVGWAVATARIWWERSERARIVSLAEEILRLDGLGRSD